ncbi:MAG TPA: glycosyltransferase family 1 protein [Candidatus Omnitrophica bacterium]|nr:glycosyltransferase family 1 protein [Candidatus Omnitrophota bacterium]
MNIFYDNTIFSIQRYGGVSRYFSEIIKRITEYDDVSVDVFKGLSILPYRFSKLNNVLLDYKLLRHKYDIYHPTYYSALVKKRKGIKTIVTVYDMIHELYSSKFKILDNGIDTKKKSILNADHVICISMTTKKDLMKIYNIKDERVSVTYLGVSLNNQEIASLIPFARNDMKKPYLLYVGRRSDYKNFKILLKAFNALNLKKDFDLVCFGGGMFSKDELIEFKKLQLEDSIKYTEGSDEVLYSYYKNAHIFIYPSLYEGFGFPVLEAMSNNCMVIASNGGSIPEIAGGAAMLFSPDNVDELSSSIQQAINDSHLREEYIKKGRGRAMLFSWDKTAMETYNVYGKVLNGEIRQ